MSILLAVGIYLYAKKKKITFKSLFASAGTSPVRLEDYEVENAKITLSLSNGKSGSTINIELRKEGKTVGSLKAAYAATMALSTTAYGYLDLFVDNTDLGSVYVPYQLSGDWTVEKAKAVDETAVLNLQFSKVGTEFFITDTASNAGWTNVEYWYGTTFLGNALANCAVEPMLDQQLTKKRWGNFLWQGLNNDGLEREISQLTFKIVAA